MAQAINKKNIYRMPITPSLARMTNWSWAEIFLCVTSGTEMSPKSLTQWSPNALDMASPGDSSFGSHTL